MGLFSRKTDTTDAGAVAVLDHTDFDAATKAVGDTTGDYVIDPTHSRIGFSARHAMVTTVRGQFDEFEGTAHIDAANPAASSVSITIKAASVTTGQEQRDGHLKTPRLLRHREPRRHHLRLHLGRARRRRLVHHR